jgi:predicted Zn-dependent protease
VKEAFFALAARLAASLRGNEVLLCNLSAERSDFVRFNHARVRQAGSVEQAYLTLRLIAGRRHASATLSLGGDGDAAASQAALQTLRQTLDGLPEDPWLLFNESPQSSESVRRGTLAPVEAIVDEVTAAAGNADLVGIYAAGTTSRGFANSLGQRNWHEVDSFNLDWSLYAEGDRAVKSSYAGFAWNAQTLAGKIAAASDELALLEKPRRDIAPGEYRAYLAPRALEEILGLLAWGGFSARARATKQSPLLRMESGARLSPRVSMSENTAEGVSPAFQADGFLKPAKVELISHGRLAEPLISPRSAKEYGLTTNAAGGGESPDSLDVAAGELEEKDALHALGRGLRISNLWYLNFSDRPAGRMTGMTRFATFWVEEGRVVAPASALRFDDSIYRLLGEELVGLTRGRELLLDASTYGERSTRSARLPGALVRSMRFTL